MKNLTLLRLTVVLAFLIGSITVAQVTTATISGTVKDSTGAVLAGAKVVLLNEETGLSRSLQTDAAGRYSASSLSLGNYRVTATLEGFQTEVRSGIVLTVGREAVVDLALSVGAVTQTLEVAGEAPVLETTSATVSGLVNQEQMRGLPLNGRSFAELAQLSPGVIVNSVSITQQSQAAQGFGPRLSVNGARADSNLYLIDGATVNDAANTSNTSGGLSLGVEGIREFRVLTHNFSAEYGRNSGSVVSAVTRSGTNHLHGSLYEFLRNNDLDTRNFFNPGALPPFRRNQFGAAAGGPVRKDRIFFFANYEGLRQKQGLTYISTVPDANARLGFLPNSTTGQLQQVTLNPVILPYLNLYPLPNGPNFGDGTAENLFDFPQSGNEDYALERMDFRLSDKDNFYWRYIYDSSGTVVPPTATPNFPATYGGINYFASLGETHIFSGTALNDFRFAFDRTVRTGDGTIPAAASDPSLAFVPGQPFGTIQFSAPGAVGKDQLTPIGTARGTPQIYIQNLFQATDSFSIVKGAHSLKVGADLERPQFNSTSGQNIKGLYQFSGVTTFLAATPSRFDALNLAVSTRERGWRRILFGWFIQDDYRLSSRLTLNLGFRHEFFTNPSEVNGKSASLINITDATSTLGPPFTTSKANFAPRVGLAWDPTGSGKTSIRGGVGVFFNQVDGRTWQQYSQNDTRFLAGYRVTNPSFPHGTPAVIPAASQSEPTVEYHLDTPTVIHYGLEVQRALLPTVSLRLGYVGSYGHNMTYDVYQNYRIPQILSDGSKFFTATAPVVNPHFADITQVRTGASDNYNALQAVLQKTVSAGLRFQVSYTYSKALSQADATTGSQVINVPSAIMDVDNLGRDYGPSGFSQRQTFVFNSGYQMPWDHLLNGKIAKAFLGGWGINGIVKASSGLPFTVQVGFNNTNNGDSNGVDRPDVKPGASNNPIQGTTAGCQGIPPGKLGTPTRWFDPCAFVLSPLGTFGNVGRDTVNGPGMYTLDFTMEKLTHLTESKQLEFRAEFFNLLNHANFGLPTQTLFDSTRSHIGNEGTIFNTVTEGREIQLGLRLTF